MKNRDSFKVITLLMGHNNATKNMQVSFVSHNRKPYVRKN